MRNKWCAVQAEHLEFFQKQLGFELVDFADREVWGRAQKLLVFFDKIWFFFDNKSTPPKIKIEPENDGLVQMIFRNSRTFILRFQPFIFRV